MTPRSTGRFVLGVVAGLGSYFVVLGPFTHDARTGWGVLLRLLLAALLITLLFTIVYDGPGALHRLTTAGHRRRR